LNNIEGEATSQINLGNINYYRKNYHDALNYYYQALKSFVQTNDKNGIAMAYNSLSIIYSQTGMFKKALIYLEKARAIYSVTRNKRKLSRVLNNMADIYSDHFKEYKKAEILYDKSLEIKEDLVDKEGIALVKCNLGVLYGQMGDLSLALKYFDESQNIYQQTGNKTGLSMVYQNEGKVLQETGWFRKAIKQFQKSMAISTKVGLKSFTLSNYMGAFKCYAALGDYENFNKYFNLYEHNKDTLSENLKKIRMAEMETQYKIDTLLQQSKNLKEESERKEIKLKRFYILTLGLSLVVVILILALILYTRAKKETKKYKVKD